MTARSMRDASRRAAAASRSRNAGAATRRMAAAAIAAAGALCASSAGASFLSGDALDTAADWIAIFVLVFVPIVLIVLFWLVHILPE